MQGYSIVNDDIQVHKIWKIVHNSGILFSCVDKMQNHNAQESIHASVKKEINGLFLSTRSVVQYFIFQYDQLIFFILDFILLIAYQCQLFGLFFPLENQRNSECKLMHHFSFEKSVMIKSMIMVNCAHFYLINDPDICERCYLHDFEYLTGFQDFQEQPLLKGMHKMLIMFASLSFVNTICLGKPHSIDKAYTIPYFFVTTWPNQMGSSLNCRRIAIVS